MPRVTSAFSRFHNCSPHSAFFALSGSRNAYVLERTIPVAPMAPLPAGSAISSVLLTPGLHAHTSTGCQNSLSGVCRRPPLQREHDTSGAGALHVNDALPDRVERAEYSVFRSGPDEQHDVRRLCGTCSGSGHHLVDDKYAG